MTIMKSLAVYGSVSGSGPYIDISDRRMKTNITKVTNALEIIDQLQAVSQAYYPYLSLFTMKLTPFSVWIIGAI